MISLYLGKKGVHPHRLNPAEHYFFPHLSSATGR